MTATRPDEEARAAATSACSPSSAVLKVGQLSGPSAASTGPSGIWKAPTETSSQS